MFRMLLFFSSVLISKSHWFIKTQLFQEVFWDFSGPHCSLSHPSAENFVYIGMCETPWGGKNKFSKVKNFFHSMKSNFFMPVRDKRETRFKNRREFWLNMKNNFFIFRVIWNIKIYNILYILLELREKHVKIVLNVLSIHLPFLKKGDNFPQIFETILLNNTINCWPQFLAWSPHSS